MKMGLNGSVYIEPLGILLDLRKTHLPGRNWFQVHEYAKKAGKKLVTYNGHRIDSLIYAEDKDEELFNDMISGRIEGTGSLVVFDLDNPRIKFSPPLKLNSSFFGLRKYPVLIEGAAGRKEWDDYMIEGGKRYEICIPWKKGYIDDIDVSIHFPIFVGNRENQLFERAYYNVVPSGVRVVRCGRPGEYCKARSRIYDLNLTASPNDAHALAETGYRFFSDSHEIESPTSQEIDEFLKSLRPGPLVPLSAPTPSLSSRR